MTAAMILLLALLLLGFPLLVPLVTASVVALAAAVPGLGTEIVVQQMIGGVKPAALVAVPMFILAADVMTSGQTAGRLLDLVTTFVAHRRGGLPMASCIACTLFGAVSGSTQATVVAIGGPIRPRLLAQGYPPGFATALIINASDIALLIPPSIGMIVYGVVTLLQ
jgi:TRAP-type C4-dicarboxylate transport system permease large subunit